MAANVQSDVYSKRFALRVSTMINARLIWFKHYYSWADDLIAELDDPPTWLLEIATIKYYPDALAAISAFAYSEPFEALDPDQFADEYIACLFLRYQSGAVSWATFLENAGSYIDGNGGRRDCEYFYLFLNELEDSEYAGDVESRQRGIVESEFSLAVSTIRPLYNMFMKYFRQYVSNEA